MLAAQRKTQRKKNYYYKYNDSTIQNLVNK